MASAAAAAAAVLRHVAAVATVRSLSLQNFDLELAESRPLEQLSVLDWRAGTCEVRLVWDLDRLDALELS